MRVCWIHVLAASAPVICADGGHLPAYGLTWQDYHCDSLAASKAVSFFFFFVGIGLHSSDATPEAGLSTNVGVLVANMRGAATHLLWTHSSSGGSETFLQTIQAGASVRVEAFVGHELYARSIDGQLLGFFRVGSEPSQSFNVRDPLQRLRDGSGHYHPDPTTVLITFLNDRDELARVYWRNPQSGEELFMGEIKSKLFFDLVTWRDAQLVARDEHGKQIGKLFMVGAAKRQQFTLEGEDTGEAEEVAEAPILEEDAQFDEF